jgi:hypothetical protein
MTDDYTTTNGDVGIIYGENNSSRLTSYHRLDINVKHKIFFGSDAELELIGSLTNVYDRKNIFYVSGLGSEIIYQLPILPSIGMTFKF